METNKITYHIEERDLHRALSSFKLVYYTSWVGLGALFLPGIITAIILIAISAAGDQATWLRITVVSFFIILFFTSLMLLVAILRIWVFPKFAARRQYDDTLALRKEHVASWNDKQIVLENANGVSIIPWVLFHRIVERKHQFLLIFDERVFLFLPKSVLDYKQLADLQNIIALNKHHKNRNISAQ